jgi:hypothetical protein
MIFDKIPYTLDWGVFRADAFNSSANEVIHIFNFSIHRESDFERILRFVVSRVLWAKFNLSKKTMQKIIFDFRGQNVSSIMLTELECRITQILSGYSINLKSLEIKK